MTGWDTLVQAEDLARALGRDDVAVVDCRFSLADPQAGERAYAQAHVPGAVYAHLDRDLSDHSKQGQGRHPWPEAADFTAKLGAWGIGPQTQVVAYDDADGAYAARFWFLLQALGHRRAAVLDGGWARWNALGLPVETDIRTPVRTDYEAEFDADRLLDAVRVQAHLDAGGLLVDARAAERFRGETEPLDRVAGHVLGARNRPYALNLADGRFKPRERLAQEFRELLRDSDPREMVAMCGSGVTACHHLLAMAYAALPGAKLFTGSWSGWISDPKRPVATGPE
ncbi:sulfurtransferase [Luteimonas gilva]|uniref:Sulfurtransferase n=1 Tax=Luteimonas gilva TaxID=2572684 RepID=A0A4U5JZH8_9GAMM|nr:sulfurtransferase [Luteimonas gilva]TKR33697.1 sulfurtransferase [Luteimonas gilva]